MSRNALLPFLVSFMGITAVGGTMTMAVMHVAAAQGPAKQHLA